MSAVLAHRSLAAPTHDANIVVRRLGIVDYSACWQGMREFSARRGNATQDEIWLAQHPPVFTLGLAGKPEHILDAGTIPLVRCDRGGQATYHGPGQAIAYVLCDLKRRGLTVRTLVQRLEQGVIELLSSYGVTALRQASAPGVYVDGAKIAALGLRVVRGCCYHGIALNVDMDLAPYVRINPCGYAGMRVTQMRALGLEVSVNDAASQLGQRLYEQLMYEPCR